MNCTNCGGADVRRADVRSAFWHDDRLVVVEDIPALLCGACGEQFYDDARWSCSTCCAARVSRRTRRAAN